MGLVVFVAVCPVCHLAFLLASVLLLVSAGLPVSRISLSVSVSAGPPISVLQVSVPIALGASSSPLSPLPITEALVVSVVVAVAVALAIVLYPIPKRSPSKPLLVSVGSERLPVVPELPPVSIILGPARPSAARHPPGPDEVARRREGGFHPVGRRHPEAPRPRRGPSVHHVGRHVARRHQGEALHGRRRHPRWALERDQTWPRTQEASGWSLQPNNRGGRWWRDALGAWKRGTDT